jgi:hypothetical protein
VVILSEKETTVTEDPGTFLAFRLIDSEWQSKFLNPDGSVWVRRAIPVDELIKIILELEEALKGTPAKPSARQRGHSTPHWGKHRHRHCSSDLNRMPWRR